jgi:uncharacterized membrane protein YhiD involved in acid resistance
MDQLNFADIFQKSFVALSMGSAERLTPIYIITNLIISFAVALFIFYIYRKTFQGVLYQRSFNISLVITSTVTSLVIMTISGNLILSLGMVGALSIVRFRTPIKDSIDLAFVFWAISVGIANGVGYYNISIIGSFIIAAVILILTNKKEVNDAYLFIAHLSGADKERILLDELPAISRKWAVKSKIVTPEQIELIIEMRLPDGSARFLNEALDKGLITKGTLLSYSGDLSSV